MICQTCKRELDVPGDIRSENCGGDCLQCMAEFGDPDCREALREAGLPVPPEPTRETPTSAA